VDRGTRYAYQDLPFGVPEIQPLDFYSPYGCSKGAADQYVRDYARIYGIPTCVFRVSCIYGPRQCGNEDQGWVAHFALSFLRGEGLTIYGDGKQVRDVLYVEDLLDAWDAACDRISDVAGEVFNVGGGPDRTVSLLELIDYLREHTGRSVPIDFGDWRPGDQNVYIGDIRKAQDRLGWRPRRRWQEGVDALCEWARSQV